MENKFLPLGYSDMLERMKYKDMLERMSSTTDPQYSDTEQFVSPLERGPTEKFGDLIGKGLLKLPYVFEDERSAMRSGQDVANVLSFAPGPGNVLGYLEGQKLEEEGRPLMGSIITGLSAGFPGAGKGAASITTPPVRNAPTPKGLEHKILHTADRPKEVKDVEKWNSDLATLEDSTEVIDVYTGETPYINRQGLMPLRYGENDTQMTSQIALFESDLYTAKNKNKVYPIENIFQAMRRYGVTGKGNINQNVARQIEDFISPEFIAKGKASPADVMEELQKNAPNIQETHAYNNLSSTMDPGVNTAYSRFTTRRPLYDLDSPTTTVGNSAEQTSRSYGERTFSMFDDGRIYGKKPSLEEPNPKVSFQNNDHDDLAMGRISVAGSKPSGENKYMHSRYTLEDIDGDANVYVKQEAQSDAYTFTKDQDMLATRLSAAGDRGGRNSIGGLQYELSDPALPGDEALYARINSGDFEAVGELVRTRSQVQGGSPLGSDLYNHLLVTNKLDDFNEELGKIIRSGNEEFAEQKRLANSFNEGDIEGQQAFQDLEEIADRNRQREMRVLSEYAKELFEGTESSVKPINLPRSADWFTDGFKLDLQTAVKNDSPYALFPNGARSLAPPSGVTTIIPPKMVPFIVKKYKDKKGVRLDYDDDGKFLGVAENKDGKFRRVLDAEPDPSSINRAKSYNDFYKKAIKQTEQDYGVKLNPTEYIDQYGQEYLKIILTPELKSSFQTFRMEHGGVASLMPLHYGL